MVESEAKMSPQEREKFDRLAACAILGDAMRRALGGLIGLTEDTGNDRHPAYLEAVRAARKWDESGERKVIE